MMQRIHGVAVILAAVAFAPAVAQTTDLAAVNRHLQAVSSMTAAFRQTDRNGKVLDGILTLKRPGKIRFQYQQGVPLLIVGDGKALTFIDYQVAQVQRWPIGNSPLGVLLDPSRDMTKFAKIAPSSDPKVLVVEARDPKRPEFGTLTLAFTRRDSAPAGLMLEGWVTRDSQGNRTSIRLSNQRFNTPVSDEAFSWRDPRPKTRGR